MVKTAGLDTDVFEGTARVFDGERAALDALEDGTITHGDVVVIRYEGPKGGPGCGRCSPSPARSRAPGSAKTCCC
ncbi:dehydratase family protein [Mycobacterium ulcerans str. Harvey]|uniref:Dehydratase family protein n=1 Tax=Mycobacterium ulcerans str. Harvey TaxID=1299332 RepID=A0ABP3APZ0_MYCUL|nr:dehydratase family protein [Mycobacterium ulcerans str. Harvey]